MTIDWQTLLWNGANAEHGTCVNVTSREALLADIETCLSTRTGFSVATLNLDHVVKLRRDPVFAKAYAAQSHVTADGNPIVWLLRLAGHHVTLTPGSELVEPVIALAARHDVPVAFFGSSTESLQAAGSVLMARNPGLRIAAQIAPPMGFDPQGAQADQYIVELIASGARVVFVALGAPKQELLAARIAEACPEMGLLSIGAGLDFLSGAQTRAPELAQALALEWAWRLGQSPGRLWRRYAKCAAIVPGLTLNAARLRRVRAR